MAEQVKVFKNVVDQVVPVTATDVVLHTTSSTQRAVLRDLDCINLGAGVTLDLDGRTMNTGTSLGNLERTKSLIMDVSSTLKLKFPARASTAFKGMFFSGGAEGINSIYVESAADVLKPTVTSITNAANVADAGSAGFVHEHSTTGVITFYRIKDGMVFVHNEDGTLNNSFDWTISIAAAKYAMCSDGTYMYCVKSATLIGRRHIETGVDSDFTVTGASMVTVADNQGSYMVHHNGKLYSKNSGGNTNVSTCTISTGVVTLKTDNKFNVGSYSDGATVVTNTSNVSFLIEQGGSGWYYWNLSTDALIYLANGTNTSTEYGNGACEVAAGIALIFGEQNDRATIIDTNFSTPTWSTFVFPNNPYALHQTVGQFSNRFTIAGGVVNIPARSYSAYVAGIDITED